MAERLTSPFSLAGLEPDAADVYEAEQARRPPAATWTQALRENAAEAMVAAAGLPEPARERLLAHPWEAPEDLRQAIEAERAYLASLRQGSVIDLGQRPPRERGFRVQGMTTGMDHMAAAVDYLFGLPGAPTPEPMLRKADILYAFLTGDDEFQGVFRPERVRLSAADTGTLTGLAVNAMNKVIGLQLAQLTHYRWYELVARLTPNDGSLHDMQWISFGGISTLPAVPEGGAYDELATDDAKESDAWITYGGYVGISRKMIKNSDIQRIQAVPRALAAAAVKTRSAKIASIFTANNGAGPTLDQVQADRDQLRRPDWGDAALLPRAGGPLLPGAGQLRLWPGDADQLRAGSGRFAAPGRPAAGAAGRASFHGRQRLGLYRRSGRLARHTHELQPGAGRPRRPGPGAVRRHFGDRRATLRLGRIADQGARRVRLRRQRLPRHRQAQCDVRGE
jgi:hypothetical protein